MPKILVLVLSRKNFLEKVGGLARIPLQFLFFICHYFCRLNVMCKDVLGEIFSGVRIVWRVFLWEKFAMGEFSAGKILQGGIFLGCNYPLGVAEFL